MKRQVDDLGYTLVLAVVWLTVLFLVAPIIVAGAMSLDSRTYLGPFPPPDLSLQWYERFFTDKYFLRGLQTSLILAVIAASISTVVGVLTAVVIDRYEFKGKEAMTTFFLSPLVVPAVVVGFALLMFFSLTGVYDGFWRLLGGHVIITVPYTIRTTIAGLVGISPSLTEAALSLGAKERAAFWEITFPLARTGIIAGTIFAFAFSMDDVAVSLFLTDPKNYTLPVALISSMRANFDLTIAAAALFLVALTVVLILVLDRLVGLDRMIGQGIYRS